MMVQKYKNSILLKSTFTILNMLHLYKIQHVGLTNDLPHYCCRVLQTNQQQFYDK